MVTEFLKTRLITFYKAHEYDGQKDCLFLSGSSVICHPRVGAVGVHSYLSLSSECDWCRANTALAFCGGWVLSGDGEPCRQLPLWASVSSSVQTGSD